MRGINRAILTIALFALAAGGCSNLRSAVGVGKNPPDEFAIVTKAPLVIPPDYSLQPPKPGESRPQEASPSQRAQQLLVGDRTANPPSEGELAVLQQAGALDVDQNIRAVLAAENGGWAEKDESLANRLMFWRINADGSIDDSAAPLRVENPEEWFAERQDLIEAVTGGQQVTINKNAKVLNLPGVR